MIKEKKWWCCCWRWWCCWIISFLLAYPKKGNSKSTQRAIETFWAAEVHLPVKDSWCWEWSPLNKQAPRRDLLVYIPSLPPRFSKGPEAVAQVAQRWKTGQDFLWCWIWWWRWKSIAYVCMSWLCHFWRAGSHAEFDPPFNPFRQQLLHISSRLVAKRKLCIV